MPSATFPVIMPELRPHILSQTETEISALESVARNMDDSRYTPAVIKEKIASPL